MRSKLTERGTIGRYTRLPALLPCMLLFACGSGPDPAASVDPFIGTDASHIISPWRSEGSTYPGAVAPHGMVQVSPETSAGGEWLQGYYYSHDTIRFFSLAEHFSGWPDGSSGKGRLMPFCLPGGVELPEAKEIVSFFSHDQERAEPGFYSVVLQNGKIRCSFAALTRSAMGEIWFSGEGRKGLMLSPVGEIRRISDRSLLFVLAAGRGEFAGGSNTLYLRMEFDRPVRYHDCGDRLLLFLPGMEKGGSLSFRFAGSYTSSENALLNLRGEMDHWDLEKVRKASRELWNNELGHVEIMTRRGEDRVMFYTALYHASLLPLVASDLNGQYPGQKVRETLPDGDLHFLYFTPWDAFRTLHPLISFLRPEKCGQMMRSLIRHYRATGRLPEPEVMTGVHCSALFADALARGVDDFDLELAYRGLREMILEEPYFRPSMASYESLGYVPYPEHYATTATLEFAYNDWCLSRLAMHLNRKEEERYLGERSFNFRNNYHVEERFMRSRDRHGKWAEVSLYAEADKWNASWFVPHNNTDLVNLMGGSRAFTEQLETNFTEGHFVLDNECPMNFPFLFAWTDEPWRTHRTARRVLRDHFNDTPGGIPGNDDYGSMSAWFLWTSAGLFPATPGSDELIISAPIFDAITFHRDNGEFLRIRVRNNRPENCYVTRFRLGRKTIPDPYITSRQLYRHGKVTIRLGDKPAGRSGAAKKPFSVTDSQPDFHIRSLGAEKREVFPDEPFHLSVEMENLGSTGSHRSQALLDGRPVSDSWIMLGREESGQLQIPLKLYQPGEQWITVDGDSCMVVVLPDSAAKDHPFRISQLSFQSLVNEGETLPYEFSIQNFGGRTQREVPALYLDGDPVEGLNAITLDPGEKRLIRGELPPRLPGDYRFGTRPETGTIFRVCRTAADALVLYYMFDEEGDSIKDHSGFGNTGELVGQPEYVEGRVGKGIRTTKGSVRIPGAPSMELTGDQITVMCWYRPMDEKGQAALVTRGGWEQLKMTAPWQVRFNAGSWGKGCVFHTVGPDPGNPRKPSWNGRWLHLAGVLRNDSLLLYVNGEMKQSMPHRGGISPTESVWMVGNNVEYPDQRRPEGIIDDVRIYGRGLRDAEIRHVMKAEGIKTP